MYAHTHSFHSHGMPEYRCPREVSTALCIHDVECIEPNCSGHGSCNLGSCSCDPPWIGEGCESLNCSLTDCSGHGSCTAEGTLMRVSEPANPPSLVPRCSTTIRQERLVSTVCTCASSPATFSVQFIGIHKRIPGALLRFFLSAWEQG